MSEYLQNVRARIEALGMDFQFTGTITTNQNGMERKTWLLEYEGDPFVFVPGQKNVVLGWDTSQCTLGEGVLRGLQEEFAAGNDYYEEKKEGLLDDYQMKIDRARAGGDAEHEEKHQENIHMDSDTSEAFPASLPACEKARRCKNAGRDAGSH